MATIQSNLSASQSSPSAIELADRAHRNLFVWQLIFVIIAALGTAILTWFVWRAGNRYQDAVKADADARIAEAGNSAAIANEKAAKALERAGGLEVRAKELEGQNLKLRSGVAGLEKEAANARAEQQKIQTEMAKQQERAVNAERALEKLKSEQEAVRRRVEPRVLPPVFRESLKEKRANTPVTILYKRDDPEAHGLATSIGLALESAGWRLGIMPRPLRQEEAALPLLELPPVIRIGDVAGILMTTRRDGRAKWPTVGEDWASATLMEAFTASGFEVKGAPPIAALVPADRVGTEIVIVVGSRP